MQPSDAIDIPARIGLVADTHRRSGGTRSLPEDLLRGLDGCDAIFHLGDFNTEAVVGALEAIAPVFGVYGNNDEPELVQKLPEKRCVAVGARRLGLIHGHQAGRNARGAAIAAMAGEVDCAIYGHSHMPDCSRAGRLLLVNPGSPTQRRRAPNRSFAIMTIAETNEIHVEFVNVR